MGLNNNINKKDIIKAVIILWTIAVIVAVVLALVINVPRIGKQAVMIKCAPYTAKIYIDQKSVNNNGIDYISAGEHEVMCFLPGFQIEEQKVTINDDNGSILIELLPTTSEGEALQKEKINDYYDLESYAGFISRTEDGAKYDDKAKALLRFLPYNTYNYGLGMQVEDGHTIVTVTVWKPGYIQMAVSTLLQMAKDEEIALAQYDFRINNFNNQLSEFQDNTANDLENYILNGYSDKGLSIEINRIEAIENYQYALISVGQPNGGRVIYRALFEQGEDQFVLLSEPYPILTKTNTPDISTDILNEVNNQEILLRNNT